MAMLDLWFFGLRKKTIRRHRWKWTRITALRRDKASCQRQIGYYYSGRGSRWVSKPCIQEASLNRTPSDIYCYVCNDAKLDLELATHLATFGINVQTQKKTEKSMTELVSACGISVGRLLSRYLSAN